MEWKPRESQKIPTGEWRTWLILAGRGFGKTRTGSETIKYLIINNKAKRIGCIGANIYEARYIMIEGFSGLLNNNSLEYKYFPSQRKIIFQNEALVQIFSADKYDSLRGFQFDWVWIDEFCKFRYPTEVMDQVNMSLRLGDSRIIITTTPKNIDILKKIIKNKSTITTRGSSYENKENLSSGFLENLNQYKNTNFEKQEIQGEIVEDKSLWNSQDISYGSSDNIFAFSFGIDPAIGKGTTGIIQVGFDTKGHIFVLEDFSTTSDIKYWSRFIYDKASSLQNCEINIEVNQGGEIFHTIFNNYGNKIKLNTHRAYRSKYNRASDIYFLYKQKIIWHSKKLKELEEEMLNTPKDRVDALVWALIKLPKRKNFDCHFVY